jgi:hypothetical protein
MTTIDIPAPPPAVIARAELALICAPFRLRLLEDMAERGIALRSIGESKDYLKTNLNFGLNLGAIENQLLWLIQVGILRREVDGQGITDSFRLTPLGHYLLAKWQLLGELATPTTADRLANWWAKWQPRKLF